MQNNCTRETRKATHLDTPRAAWLFLGSRNASLAMSKCIHASEHIVDTLEFFPQNYKIPQLSSTDRLIMAAKDMMDAYKILIRKYHSLASEMTPSRHLLNWLQSSNSNYDKLNLQRFQLRLQGSNNAHVLPILASPIILPQQTRSQTTIHTQDMTDAPLPPRVITPRTLSPSPPRVPTRSQRLSPRNLSQNDFFGMDTAHMAIALGNNHWSRQHLVNTVINTVTGK
jgi:hypothetical protein